jgi:hypothetical protein
MKNYKRSGIVCAIAGAATAVAMSFAQTAKADEASFINDVAAHGVYTAPITLAVGHQVCSDASANGTAGINTEAAAALSSGVTAHDAAVIIVEAVYDLCPSNMPALDAWLSTPNMKV